MTNPPIWDDAYEVLGQYDAHKAESKEKDIAFREITEEADLNMRLNAPAREITEEADLNMRANTPDKLAVEEISFTIVEEPFDHINRDRIKSVKDIYRGAIDNLFKIFQLISENRDFSIDPVFSYACGFVSHLKVEPNTWMQLLYTTEKDTDTVMNIVKHSLDTVIIAVRLGIGLKLQDDRLEEIAMQAFFHDVGMLRLPPELIQKMGKLTPEELKIIKKHPEHGYGILNKFEGKYQGIANIIYQEHERYDGSGYPNGRKGSEIPENSLIIGISDTYTALLHPRPYRPRHLPFEAIKEIIVTSKEQFPHHIIKTLVNEFSAFPEGIYVRLNSQEVGKVITVNKLAPLSPVVEILYTAEGKLLNTKKVDLMKDNCLHITTAFYGEED